MNIATLTGIGVAVALVLYFVITEGLDWLSRMDTVEHRWPGLGANLRAFVDNRALRVVIGIVAISLLVKVLIDLRSVHRPPDGSEKPSGFQSAKPDTTPGAAPPNTAPIDSPAQAMTLPDGRTIITSSPEELQATFRANTIPQFNRLLSGKWIKMSVRVEDIWSGGRIYAPQAPPPDPPMGMILQFSKGWDDELSKLARGSTVTVRCRITEARPSSIGLDACELL